MATYKVGQAPWETTTTVPTGSFEVGKAPWEQPVQEPEKPGFLKSLYKSIAEPVVNLIARPGQAVQAALGKEVSEGKFLGLDINNPQSAKDVVKDVGRAAETVALGIGGGGTIQSVKTGLKGLVGQAAKQEAITGLKAGGLIGFGQGLEQASEEPPEQAFNTIFGSTAIGAGLGLVSGGVLGAATPIVAKGVSGVRKFANVGELETKLANGYKKILNPTARQIKVDSRFGNDSFNFLAKEAPDLPLSVNKDGRVDTTDALEMARQKYTAEATAYKPIIRNSGKFIDIDKAIADAKKVAKKEFDGSDLTRAEQQIDDEVNAFLANSPQDVNVTANGKRFITLARADDIKSYSWNRGRGWGTPEAEVWSDTNNLIGHALKDAIEKELPDVQIKAMNKRLGQWKNAIDMLERRNGNVSGSGGKLSKYLIRSVGTAVGSGLGGQDGSIGGGITGATTGFVTAGAIAALMSNPNIRLSLVRQILKRLNKAGKGDMIKEAEQILQQESSKYLLPGAGQSSYVEKPSVLNLPQSARETNLGLDEVRNMKSSQMPSASQMSEPKQNPTTNEIKNTIDNGIPQKGNIATNPLLAGAGATGALAVGAKGLSEATKPIEYTAKTESVEDSKDTKLADTLMQLESSGGKDKSNAGKTEMNWLVGLTPVAIAELKRTGAKDSVDVDNKKDVIDAGIKYFKLLQKRFPKLSPAEIYVDKYWTQWKNLKNPKEARAKKIAAFNKLMAE